MVFAVTDNFNTVTAPRTGVLVTRLRLGLNWPFLVGRAKTRALHTMYAKTPPKFWQRRIAKSEPDHAQDLNSHYSSRMLKMQQP